MEGIPTLGSHKPSRYFWLVPRWRGRGGKPGAVFGEGTVHWKEVFEICETTGETKQYVIEEEGRASPEAPEDVRRAIQNFRKTDKRLRPFFLGER